MLTSLLNPLKLFLSTQVDLNPSGIEQTSTDKKMGIVALSIFTACAVKIACQAAIRLRHLSPKEHSVALPSPTQHPSDTTTPPPQIPANRTPTPHLSPKELSLPLSSPTEDPNDRATPPQIPANRTPTPHLSPNKPSLPLPPPTQDPNDRATLSQSPEPNIAPTPHLSPNKPSLPLPPPTEDPKVHKKGHANQTPETLLNSTPIPPPTIPGKTSLNHRNNKAQPAQTNQSTKPLFRPTRTPRPKTSVLPTNPIPKPTVPTSVDAIRGQANQTSRIPQEPAPIKEIKSPHDFFYPKLPSPPTNPIDQPTSTSPKGTSAKPVRRFFDSSIYKCESSEDLDDTLPIRRFLELKKRKDSPRPNQTLQPNLHQVPLPPPQNIGTDRKAYHQTAPQDQIPPPPGISSLEETPREGSHI